MPTASQYLAPNLVTCIGLFFFEKETCESERERDRGSQRSQRHQWQKRPQHSAFSVGFASSRCIIVVNSHEQVSEQTKHNTNDAGNKKDILSRYFGVPGSVLTLLVRNVAAIMETNAKCSVNRRNATIDICTTCRATTEY